MRELRIGMNSERITIRRNTRGLLKDHVGARVWAEKHAAKLTDANGHTHNFDGSPAANRRYYTLFDVDCADEAAWQAARTDADELDRSQPIIVI